MSYTPSPLRGPRTQRGITLALSLLLAGCADRIDPSADGTLVISTSTLGADPDENGYLLTVDGGDSLHLSPTGTSHVDVPSGKHTLGLLDVAGQCSVNPASPLPVDVPPGGSILVAFHVTCSSTAAIISVTTTGPDIDSTGYDVTVDDTLRAGVLPNGGVLIRLEPGSRVIALTRLPPNCTTVGPASQTVTIANSEVKRISFAVTCTATTGVVGILIKPSGPAVYEMFDARMDQRASVQVLPGGPHYLPGVLAGDHVISLASSVYSPDCSVETAPQPVTVAVGDTVEVSFSVTCSLAPENSAFLRISAHTTGRIEPSTHYGIWYASSDYWDPASSEETNLSSIGPNGTFLTEVAASGTNGASIYWYDFQLRNVPANCKAPDPLSPTSPGYGFAIEPGDTLEVKFEVTCSP